MLTLYSSPTSPYVRKVLIVARETGTISQIDTVFGGGSPVEPNAATRAVNPLGKIPCLARPDGPAIFDSPVICQYLDSLHHGHKLYPAGAARWSALTLEALADGILDALVLCLYETRLRPEPIRFAPWVDAQRLKVTQALDALEAQWIAHLNGPLDIGGVAVGATLGYIDFRFPDIAWRNGRPALSAWHAAFAERDSYKATVPVG